VRDAFSSLDPTLPIQIETMQQRLSGLVQRPRFNAVLLALFAAIGVVLAAVGLYGVVSFLVGQSTQEIGVRMALGASPQSVVRWMLSRAARWTAAGIVTGTIAAVYATRLMRNLLFGVPERDLFTFAVAVPLLAVIAMLAAWLPSRKAAAVDPITALRHE